MIKNEKKKKEKTLKREKEKTLKKTETEELEKNKESNRLNKILTDYDVNLNDFENIPNVNSTEIELPVSINSFMADIEQINSTEPTTSTQSKNTECNTITIIPILTFIIFH